MHINAHNSDDDISLWMSCPYAGLVFFSVTHRRGTTPAM